MGKEGSFKLLGYRPSHRVQISEANGRSGRARRRSKVTKQNRSKHNAGGKTVPRAPLTILLTLPQEGGQTQRKRGRGEKTYLIASKKKEERKWERNHHQCTLDIACLI